MESPILVQQQPGIHEEEVLLQEPISESEVHPIMQFVYFHKALRAQLHSLHEDALFLRNNSDIQVLLDKYRFLRSIYEHHTTAEDEVLLPALDLRVKNIAHTYSLEHRVESNLFDHIFEHLNTALQVEDNEAILRDVICRTEVLHTTLCQHLSKEEEQVFPLLMKHFSFDEQAALVWKFLCSIPVDLMEKLLPWLASSLSAEDHKGLVTCMQKVVPRQELLQQVVFTWLHGNTSGRTEIEDIKTISEDGGSNNQEGNFTSFDQGTLQEYLEDMSLDCGEPLNHMVSKTILLRNESLEHPINEMFYWHNAIRKELAQLTEDAKRLRDTQSSGEISMFIERLQFLADVCVFHSAAEDKVVFPAVDRKSKKHVSYVADHAEEERGFHTVRCLIRDILVAEDKSEAHHMHVKLCAEAESIEEMIRQHLHDEEIKVIPLVQKHCSVEEQRLLVYQSFRVMPLKLLERVLPWLMGMLSEVEAKDMIRNMCLAAPATDRPLVALFSGWACKAHGHSILGPQNYRCFFANKGQKCVMKSLPVQEKHCSSCNSNPTSKSLESRPIKRSRYCEGSQLCNEDASCCVPELGVNLNSIRNMESYCQSSLNPLVKSSLNSSLVGWGSDVFCSGPGNKPKPIDHIFQFHKALRKDLEYLDTESSRLIDCDGEFLRQFSARFHLLWGLYRAHSNAEDDIVFPALESKEALHNVSHSYSLDHKQEEQLFRDIASVLSELSQLQNSKDVLGQEFESSAIVKEGTGASRFRDLAGKVQWMCQSIRISLDNHVYREELELWPLFDVHFTFEEQDKIVGRIIGTTGAEILQSMIPWVNTALTEEEQTIMMESWRQATRNTMFDKWLSAWWDDNSSIKQDSPASVVEEPPSGTSESLQLVAEYLANGGNEKEVSFENSGMLCGGRDEERTDHEHYGGEWKSNAECSGEIVDSSKSGHPSGKDEMEATRKEKAKFKAGWQDIFRMNQNELEAAIRRVSSDKSLDLRRKSYLIQNLMSSRWIVSQQQLSSSQSNGQSSIDDIPGRMPSYFDEKAGIFGCEHYKRNCKLRAACCGSLFTCRFCHDKASDHTMDRHATKEMMCMKCLKIQPVARACASPECGGLIMARYFCSVCKFFDDDKRDMYHCPFCNLCRVGKGLGKDYFHCMTCNACMYIKLRVHKCREKILESNCPICHDFLFTSQASVRALPCGHYMHTACFQEYTCNHYICPICSKSLGDMTVYFGMLDALLSTERLPEEYQSRYQDILCNDCEHKGTAQFHWLYHKCSQCGSYNTRAI